MKKQITAILAAVALAAGSVPALAEDSAMENALISVKSRVDIPQELSRFQSSTYSYEDGTHYNFEWIDPETNARISVSADEEGRVSFYHYFSPDIPVSGTYVYKPRADYFEAAEAFLKKAAPEMFKDDDRLVDTAREDVIVNGAQFWFERRKSGIPVEGNRAIVTVKYFNDNFYVTDCSIDIDYSTVFMAAEEMNVFEPVVYYDEFPLELVYRKPIKYYRSGDDMNEAPELVYRFKDYNAGYVSVYTGKEIKADEQWANDRGFASAGGTKEENSAADKLSPEERAELDNVKGLKSTGEIIKSISEMEVFGTIPSPDKFMRGIYKESGKYIVSLDYSNYTGYDKKNPQEPIDIYIRADGMTGELLSFYSYYYDTDHDENYTDDQYKEGLEKIRTFLEKEFGAKLSECAEQETEPGYSADLKYSRLINAIKYDNNYLKAEYDLGTGLISSFSQEWDDDVAGFADPSAAIDEASARSKMEELAPVHTVYVKSGDAFRLCYTSDGAYTEIDAVTGEKIKPPYTVDDPREYVYSDISGHWAEDIIKAVAQYGAGLPGTEFRPDDKITQKELLRMLTAGMYIYEDETDDLYSRAEDIIPKNEKAPNDTVLREDAFMYVARLMGFGRLATMDIFTPGFNDGADITPEKTGALAILRGYGIVKGDAGEVRPKDSLTRAEAAALMYGYLTTEK